jgi:hypothetical protein
MEFRAMNMPARSGTRRLICSYKLGNDTTASCFCYAQIAISKKVS